MTKSLQDIAKEVPSLNVEPLSDAQMKYLLNNRLEDNPHVRKDDKFYQPIIDVINRIKNYFSRRR